jgi:hypothetical protein
MGTVLDVGGRFGATGWIRGRLRRVRERGPESLGRAARLTTAAVASYLAAVALVADHRPVTAPLTALLIVQVTLVGTFTDTVRRILSVVAGVGVAVVISSFVGFSWWSLGAIVGVAILLGQALNLGPHLLEVPISAMLILAAGGSNVLAKDRIAETLVGAAVGLFINLVVPPSTRTASAGAAIESFSDSVADLLARASARLGEGAVPRDEARSWLAELRTLSQSTRPVDLALTEAHRSRRLNPRAVGTSDPVPDLRSGLDALEHCAVALRAVFRSIADAAGPPDGDGPDEVLTGSELRHALATLFGDLGRAIAGFGDLARTYAHTAGDPETAELGAALDTVRRDRARLNELLMVNALDDRDRWPVHGSLLSGIDRVLAELDVDDHAREREVRRQEAAARRRRGSYAAERLRSSTRRAVGNPPIAPRRRRPD